MFSGGSEGTSMGVAAAKWAAHECWSAEGLLLSTDEFIPLHGSPEVGYRAGPPEPFHRRAGEWVEVDPRCRSEACGLLVEAGGGPVEAEGFVAVTMPCQAAWCGCCTFRTPRRSPPCRWIEARWWRWPTSTRSATVFRIPIGEPQMLRVQSQRHA
jgi:hypothetical protein